MNYYELLNIGRGADSNDIKRAYFSAVKLHSPDSDPEGFKALRTAYETLSNDKNRSLYDSYFISTAGETASEIQNELLKGHELIRENRYSQAETLLNELVKKYPDSAEARRLLARVLLYLKKSATADKICEELLEKNPSDCDTLLLRAKIAINREQKAKATACFNKAVKVSPLNRRAWIEYMRYALEKNTELVPGIFQSAMKKDPDMFRDDYILYLAGTNDIDLFSETNYVQYYEKFAEFFVNDKNHEEDMFEHLMYLLPQILKNEKLIPFAEKILPTLENSSQLINEPRENFVYIHKTIEIQKLNSDERIHEVFRDLSILLFSGNEDKNEQQAMESYIVYKQPELQKSIQILMKEYPETFKLNQAFYLDVLNEKKLKWLINKYSESFMKLNPDILSDLDPDYDDDEDVKPFIRASPKTGRNDPCPCGSGKKYKKCCGKAL